MAKGKQDAWFPFYTGDYTRDAGRFTTQQHGAYLLILIDLWSHGSVPDQDAILSSLTKTTPDDWAVVRPVLEPFFIVANGEWRHKRVDAEREKASAVSAKRSAAGKAGAAAKWQGDGNSHPDAIPDAKADASQNDGQSQSQSHSQVAAAGDDADKAAAAAILKCWEDALLAVYGNQTFGTFRHVLDQDAALRFVAAGADAAFCRPIIDSILQREKAKGRPAPQWLAYFEEMVGQALFARRPRQVTSPLPGSDETAQQSAQAMRDAWQVRFIKKGISLGLHGSDADVRSLVARGLVTREEAERAGYSIDKAA